MRSLDPEEQERAADAAIAIQDPRAIPVLEEILERHADSRMKLVAAKASVRLRSFGSIPLLSAMAAADRTRWGDQLRDWAKALEDLK